MSIGCEVILRWDATPAQQRALGLALWVWCRREAGDSGMYQYLDNQALADLLARRLPAPGPVARCAGLPYVPFLVGGDPARGREAVLESLRRALPGGGVDDVRVGGLSWRPAEGVSRTTTAAGGSGAGELLVPGRRPPTPEGVMTMKNDGRPTYVLDGHEGGK